MIAIPACSICWDKFSSNSTLLATKCGHLFHGECIERWLNSNSSCPECRQVRPSLYRMYLNFNYNIKDEDEKVLEDSAPIASPQEIENLILKLSLEEQKCKAAETLLQEKEQNYREYMEFVKENDRKQKNLVKSYQDRLKKLEVTLKKERHRRRIAEKSEEALADGLDSISICLFKNIVN